VNYSPNVKYIILSIGVMAGMWLHLQLWVTLGLHNDMLVWNKLTVKKIKQSRSVHEIFIVLISVKILSRTQDHSAARRIMSMKNSNDSIRNRTRDLPACSAESQPTAPPRIPDLTVRPLKYRNLTEIEWWDNTSIFTRTVLYSSTLVLYSLLCTLVIARDTS